MNLKCLVIDDDPLICDLVQHFCSKIKEIDYCLAADNALDGLNLLTSQNFDVLFLDYNLPDLSGKSLLQRKPPGTPVVMITSEKEFAVESYEFPDILDFIVKPVTFERFFRAVERVLESRTSSKEGTSSMFVKDANKLVQLHFDQLNFVKSESNYVLFNLPDKQIMSLISMKELIKRLPDHFVRIHRSYIVNVHKIDFISPEEVSVNQHSLPIGQKYKAALMEKIQEM